MQNWEHPGRDLTRCRRITEAEPTLFDLPADDGRGDPREVAREVRRLSRQCRAILDRLRRGPATNRELAGIALKYTGRISDLRKAGFEIDCESDPATGLSRYRLAAEPPETEPASRRPCDAEKDG